MELDLEECLKLMPLIKKEILPNDNFYKLKLNPNGSSEVIQSKWKTIFNDEKSAFKAYN